MTDDELRALVRQAVARHLGPRAAGAQAAPPTMPAVVVSQTVAFVGHPSQFQYGSLTNPTEACVIEPSVGCDHCGYCKSHGH